MNAQAPGSITISIHASPTRVDTQQRGDLAQLLRVLGRPPLLIRALDRRGVERRERRSELRGAPRS